MGVPGDRQGPARSNDDGYPGTAPGSSLFLTRAQIGDGYNLPDWYPNAHPTIPQIVARGDKATALRACAFCHLPIGTGRYMYGRVGVVRLTCQIPYKNCRESPDIRVSDPDLE